jgi:hypothetical protein
MRKSVLQERGIGAPWREKDETAFANPRAIISVLVCGSFVIFVWMLGIY